MTARQRREVGADLGRRAGGRGSSCRCPAGPTAGATRGGRGRCCAGAGRARRRGGPARRTRQVARAHPGGQRLPLGRRLEEGLGAGAGGSPGGWHARMVARRATRPGGMIARSDPARGPGRPPRAASRKSDDPTTDERDPADVARDVGVLLGGRDREDGAGSRRRDRIGRPRGAGALLRGLGLALLGDDGRLELGGAGLFGVGQGIGRAGHDLGRAGGRLGGRAGGRALKGWALSRSGHAASDSLGHGLGRASITDRIGGRAPSRSGGDAGCRRQRIALPPRGPGRDGPADGMRSA